MYHLLGVLLMMTSLAHAFEFPIWFAEPLSQDPDSYFGYGLGEDPSDAKAFGVANEGAVSDLIKTNLGYEFADKTEVNSTLEEVRVQRISEETTSILKISDIKILKVERQVKPNGNIIYFVQRSIPRAIAQKIKTELEATAVSNSKFLSVTINSQPEGGVIEIDGRSLGVGPIRALLPTGAHRVKVKKVGYKPAERNLYLDQKTDYSLVIPLVSTSGTIQVRARPTKAWVYLKSAEGNTTPGDEQTLPPGEYELTVSYGGYIDQIQQVTIEPGRRTQVEVHLSKVQAKERSTYISFRRPASIAKDRDYKAEMEQLFQNGKFTELMLYIQNVYYLNFKKDILYYYYLGYSHVERGQLSLGLAELEKAYDIKKSLATASALCMANYRSQKYETAIQFCDEALAYEPDTLSLAFKGRSYFKLANANFSKRDYYTQFAVSTFQVLVAQDRSYAIELQDTCGIYPYRKTEPCGALTGRGGRHRRR